MTNENKYSSLELSKKLAPVLEGVEADAWWVKRYMLDGTLSKHYSLMTPVMKQDSSCNFDSTTLIPAARYDTLLSVLPDWKLMPNPSFYLARFPFDMNPKGNNRKMPEHRRLLNKALMSRGKAAIDAAGELILLLSENGLLKDEE